MTESIIKKLVFDFFDGKTTSMQRKLIEEWMSEEKNRELFYCYLDEWESLNPQFAPGLENALSRFLDALKTDDAHTDLTLEVPIPQKRYRPHTWYLAASVIFILLVSSVVFRKTILYKSLDSVLGKTASYTLSEGTEVMLNSNSTLLVPRFGFGDGKREVFLDGEAEFKVTHTNNNDRFIVKMANDYQVEVFGTEFVAFSRARGKRVFLKQGKVKVKLPKGQQLYMKSGNLFVADKNGAFNMTEQADPRPYVAWKEQIFYFDNTPISDIALQIQERFNVKVKISDPSLGSRRIAGIYKADEVDDLLQILSELMQIEIIQREGYIELSTPKP